MSTEVTVESFIQVKHTSTIVTNGK